MFLSANDYVRGHVLPQRDVYRLAPTLTWVASRALQEAIGLIADPLTALAAEEAARAASAAAMTRAEAESVNSQLAAAMARIAQLESVRPGTGLTQDAVNLPVQPAAPSPAAANAVRMDVLRQVLATLTPEERATLLGGVAGSPDFRN